jgi:hypothetical protein
MGMVAIAAHARNNEDDLKINQIQIVGTHNSYSQGVDPQIMAMADAIIGPRLSQMAASMPPEPARNTRNTIPTKSACRGAELSLRTLTDQLDAGMRSLELDLNRDPEGGRFVPCRL